MATAVVRTQGTPRSWLQSSCVRCTQENQRQAEASGFCLSKAEVPAGRELGISLGASPRLWGTIFISKILKRQEVIKMDEATLLILLMSSGRRDKCLSHQRVLRSEKLKGPWG